MARLDQRVSALEAQSGMGLPERSHWLVVGVGETQEAAVSEYEAANGPIDPNDFVVIWRVVAPLGQPRGSA